MTLVIQDKCEAFDWAWAFFYYLSHNYNGMGCPKYAALSKLTSEYELSDIPSIDMDNNDCEDYTMAVFYYHDLDEDNWESHFDIFCLFMDNKWDLE